MYTQKEWNWMTYEIIIVLCTVYGCKHFTVLTELILLDTIGRYYYYSCFTVEETEAAGALTLKQWKPAFRFR